MIKYLNIIIGFMSIADLIPHRKSCTISIQQHGDYLYKIEYVVDFTFMVVLAGWGTEGCLLCILLCAPSTVLYGSPISW